MREGKDNRIVILFYFKMLVILCSKDYRHVITTAYTQGPFSGILHIGNITL